MLGLEETVEELEKANGVRWCEHVLKGDDSVLRVATDLEMSGKRKRGRPKPWRKQMKKIKKKDCLKTKDALNRPILQDGVRILAEERG